MVVKEEPPGEEFVHASDLVIATHNISSADEIVLNISSAEDVIETTGIKSEPIDDDPGESESVADPEVPTLIVPWPAFVPLASHPELAVQRRKRKTPTATKNKPASSRISPEVTGGQKRARSRLEDVTALYSEEDTEENQVEKQ